MNSREITEINAGSMADIAFLLLVFFLVTTTLEKDEGIPSYLPPIVDNQDPTPVPKRNVFKVFINGENKLLVQNEVVDEMGTLKAKAIEFYTNPKNSSELPTNYIVTASLCKSKMATVGDTSVAANKTEYNLWERKLEALPLLGGSYREISPLAVVKLTHDNNTSYNTYIQVQDALSAAVNELRNKFAKDKFGKYYTEMNINSPKERQIMQAIQLVYPQRISESTRNTNITENL
jgi:biopolymer transport protein ExbD